MFSNKLIQKLLIINGILFPLIPIFMLFSLVKSEFFTNKNDSNFRAASFPKLAVWFLKTK
jgi:hypothetical protein